ncbi:MAG: proton-conducting transporter membrane subunit [Gammaproteobacteria bacterium]
MTTFALAFVLIGAAPLAALLPGRRTAPAVAWLLLTSGCACIAWVAVTALTGSADRVLAVLALPVIGTFSFTLTPLSGLFLLVTAGVFAATLPFVIRDSIAWLPARRGLFIGLVALTFAAMVALFTAADIVAFIVAWEIAALAIWGLIGFETRASAPVAAGLLTLALSETGSLAGLAGLLLLATAAGTPLLAGIAATVPSLSPGLVAAACVLTFFGFGMKAGIVPLNLWLPVAHGNAPRSISPILSGATLNLGLYAFLRLDAPLAHTDPRLGLMILATGAATALVGIVYAMIERDLKRLLAQSSIENIGIATTGFGAGFTFAALGHPVLAGLAMVAGLYHMLNHSAYKTLLFLGAGGMDVATGTHNLDRLGGLMRRLPLLGTLFLIGAFAIAALPPFNGFVSEWLTLQSLLRVVEVASVPVRITFALSGAALALTAGLAVTCFIMVAGTSLLGLPRSHEAAQARRAPRSVVVPMAGLAVVCFGLAVLATGVIPILGRLTAPLTGANPTAALVPAFFHHTQVLVAGIVHDLTQIGAQIGRGVVPLRGLVVLHSGGTTTPVIYAMSTALSFAVIVFLLLIVWLATRGLRRRRKARRRVLWDAGLARLRPEMTYNATAFASPVRVLFHGVFNPVVASHEQHHGAFLTASQHRELSSNIVERLIIAPIAKGSRATANGLARLHHGAVTAYAAYVLIALLVALLATKVLL